MGTLGGQGCPSELYRFRGGGDSGEDQTVAEVLDRIKVICRQLGHNAVSWNTSLSLPAPNTCNPFDRRPVSSCCVSHQMNLIFRKCHAPVTGPR